MKKILLATTLLTMTAGYAAADITWAGTATAGIARDGGITGVTKSKDQAAIDAATKARDDAQAVYDDAFIKFENGDINAARLDELQLTLTEARNALDVLTNGKDAIASGDFRTYSNANLAATFAGTTDGGLTFGASFDLTTGRTYNFADDDTFAEESGTFGTPSVFIAGSFGKLTISNDNIDGLDGDETNDGDYDAQYEGTFGPATVYVQADLDTGLMGVKGVYAAGAISASASYSQQTAQDDIWDISGTYTFGMIAVTAATDNASDASLKVAYTGSNGISASATYNTNGNTQGSDASYDIAAGYTANGISVSASVDDVTTAVNDEVHWTVEGSYDLGGGLSVGAGTNYTDDLYVGASMTF